MKKLAVLLVAIVAVFGVAKADDDRPIVVLSLIHISEPTRRS